MSKRVSPLKWIKRIVWRIALVLVLFWGGGIALFSFVPVPFSAVMVERQRVKAAYLDAVLPRHPGLHDLQRFIAHKVKPAMARLAAVSAT